MSATNSVMLHLGVGSFHRAHQAWYMHRLRESGDRAWSIVGGNIRNDMAETMAALIAQNGEYTLETVSPTGVYQYERIRSIREVIPFDTSLARLIEVGADAATRIISFTVTEAGYYLDAKNELDLSQADLRADLDDGARRTIYGAIAAILRERVNRGGAPVTLLSCDNLRSNGARFRACLIDFLERRGEIDLRDWVEMNTTCPCNMVDRITPRPLPEVVARVRAATGWDDLAPVMGESFIQWVIEDNFIAGRPAWERVGAELVDSVHAFEEAKIRILNATHSCVAWAGALKGLSFVYEAMAVPAIRKMAYEYITNDVIPCLNPAEDRSPIDLAKYRDVVLERFGNPKVRDSIQRVAADGFSKMAIFVLPTIRERLASGQSIASVARLPALLLAVLERWHLGNLPFAYQDSVMNPTSVHAMFAGADSVAVFTHERFLWGDLVGNKALYLALTLARDELREFTDWEKRQ